MLTEAACRLGKGLIPFVAGVILLGAYHVSYADELPVAPVDVPESYVEPTPAEIHESFPERPCSSCHNPANKEVESKWPSHFVTNKECGSCHYTQRWIPLTIYTHIGARYRLSPGQDSQNCQACHTTNSQFMTK
jgi:hypothetical protein